MDLSGCQWMVMDVNELTWTLMALYIKKDHWASPCTIHSGTHTVKK